MVENGEVPVSQMKSRPFTRRKSLLTSLSLAATLILLWIIGSYVCLSVSLASPRYTLSIHSQRGTIEASVGWRTEPLNEHWLSSAVLPLQRAKTNDWLFHWDQNYRCIVGFAYTGGGGVTGEGDWGSFRSIICPLWSILLVAIAPQLVFAWRRLGWWGMPKLRMMEQARGFPVIMPPPDRPTTNIEK